uniref:Uncharacterized protein n=1 Tax=Moniliophthora roreri TaxID=221103 RepID=A0A0W0F9I6_MONRR
MYKNPDIPEVDMTGIQEPAEPDPSPHRVYFKSIPNEWGLFRIYNNAPPLRYPDIPYMAEDITNDSTSKESCSSTEEDWLAAVMGGIWITSDAEAPVEPSVTDPSSYAPFPNITTFCLIHFLYNKKSIPALVATKLVKAIFLQPEFEKSDLNDFNAERDLRCLDRHLAERATAKSTLPFESSNVWHKTELSIPMPCPNHKKLVPLICELVKDEIFFQYHIKPHKLFVQKTESSQPMQVYGEVYTSNQAMRISHEKQVNSKSHEILFIWLMFGSDATHLTNFGMASLWPIYVISGNLSKSPHGMPTAHTFSHLGYLPHLPDLIKDVCCAHYGQAPLEETQRFLNHEVIQKAWGELLDEEFVEAFVNGLMLKCADMEERLAIATAAKKSKKSLGSQPCQFNLLTAKLHFLGDYTDSIKEYGTTDNYSTLKVEVEHKFSKKKYAQMNKNQFESQMARNKQRARKMTKINQKINKDKQGPHRALGVTKREPMLLSSPDQCFQMSNWTDYGICVSDFYNKNDPALLNFVDTLKDYALNLMLRDEAKEEYTNEDWHELMFKNDRIYQHKHLRINYPTYDLRREQDSINPQTHADIMTLNVEAKDTEEHPYCYSGIGHKELSRYLNKFEKNAGLDSQVLPEYDSDGEEMDPAPQSLVVEDEPDDNVKLCKDDSDSESDSSDDESDDKDESKGNSSNDDEFDENGDPVSVNMTLPHGEL